MPQNTILLAVKEFVDAHPDFPEDYFNVDHVNTGFFGTTVYLVKDESGWTLVELNFFQLLMYQFSYILSLFFPVSQVNLDINSFRSEMQPVPYEEGIPNKIKHLYEGLMTKILGPNMAWASEVINDTRDTGDEQTLPLLETINQESPIESETLDEPPQPLMETINQENPIESSVVDGPPQPLMETLNQENSIESSMVDEPPQSLIDIESQEPDNTFDDQPQSLMEIINKESPDNNPAVRETLQKKFLAIAKVSYKDLFHNLDQMTNEQRASLVRLLSLDVKLSLGIWNGVMHHGKAFQLSTREHVRSWIPTIIQALSLEQLIEACNDTKFWEVVDLFPEQVGAVLSLDQWKCIIEHNKESDSIVKLMLSLPVNEMLYDKLLVACGRIPIDFGKELGMKMLISKLNRYLKAHKDERSTDVLTKALRKAPPRIVLPPRLNRKEHHSLTEPHIHLAKTGENLSRPASFSISMPPASRPATPQWKDEEFCNVVKNLSQNVDTLEKAKMFFWGVSDRFSKEADTEVQNLCQKSLNYLIRYYPASVFGQIDRLNEFELQRFLMVLEQTDPALIVGIWDALMASSRELGFSNELFARNKAQRVLKYVSPQQLAACISEDKLWAVLRHYSDLAGLLFSAEHLKILAPHMKEAFVLAKIVSDLPLDDDLGDKLAVICPFMIKDPMLEMQMAAKIRWYGTHINKNKARELQNVIDDAMDVKEDISKVFSL